MTPTRCLILTKNCGAAMKNKGKLIAVVGETASGKSSLGVKIAQLYRGEIISADSRAVYKGMDIGTAKPSQEEMVSIKHYGLDLVSPDKKYSAAKFKDYATEVIADIQGRDKLPILVGGTGLYVDGVLFDYSFGGKDNTSDRSKLDNKSVDELSSIAKEKGIEISGQTKTNTRHLVRLIEREGHTESNQNLAYDALILGYRVERNRLRDRIERRVEVMFRKGLRKEYNDLRQKYDRDSEAFTGIGYREFAQWEDGEASMSEVKRAIVKNTINLAKRQRTWFKRNTKIKWVETEEEALKLVEEFLT